MDDKLLIIASRISGIHVSYIKKIKNKYCVKSKSNPDWNGGCYTSRSKAEKRLEQVEYFKHK